MRGYLDQNFPWIFGTTDQRIADYYALEERLATRWAERPEQRPGFLSDVRADISEHPSLKIRSIADGDAAPALRSKAGGSAVELTPPQSHVGCGCESHGTMNVTVVQRYSHGDTSAIDFVEAHDHGSDGDGDIYTGPLDIVKSTGGVFAAPGTIISMLLKQEYLFTGDNYTSNMRFNYGTALGAAVDIKYFFGATGHALHFHNYSYVASDGTLRYTVTNSSFKSVLPEQVKAFEEAFAEVKDLTRASFSAASSASQADMYIGRSELNTYSGFGWQGTGVAVTGAYGNKNHRRGDVLLDDDLDSDPNAGESSFRTILHEIGHAMGLGHPHDSTVIAAGHNTRQFTVMSYTGAANGLEPETFMVDDILALQYLYGADMSYMSGATTYNLNPGGPYWNRLKAIWDGGGADTLDASGAGIAVVLDLHDGAYSSVGNSNNFGIAFGAIIENAKGGSGNDRIVGNAADNRLEGNKGNDTLYGEEGDDALYGGDGNDFLRGGAGDDRIEGGAGDDRLYGDDGNDTILTGLGKDSAWGGTGNDHFIGNSGQDTFYGESGTDIVNYHWAPKGVSVDLRIGKTTQDGYNSQDILNSIENVRGSQNHDAIFGSNASNSLYGGSGNDTLYGEGGNDRLYGEDGNDWLFGGDSADYLIGGTGLDYLIGGGGADTFAIDRAGYTVADRIADFTKSHGDKLDISDILFDDNVYRGNLLQYVQVRSTGGQEYDLFVDANGSAGGANWAKAADITASGFTSAELTNELWLLDTGRLVI